MVRAKWCAQSQISERTARREHRPSEKARLDAGLLKN
jgi:hypothetical protein